MFAHGMDLDNSRDVSRLEVGAWFKHNENIVCRPWRSIVQKTLKIEKEKLDTELQVNFRVVEKDARKQYCRNLLKVDKYAWEALSIEKMDVSKKDKKTSMLEYQ